jgi:arylsulfatase A-like enzyme
VLSGATGREVVFSEINFHVAYEPQRAIRTKRWKYIRRFDERRRPVLPNCDDSPSKTLWMEHGWRERLVAEEQLYDLVFDPNEACNLASHPAYNTVVSEMRARLEEWMRETGDPLLRGPLQWPKGFPHLDPDQTSPAEIKW